MRVLLISFKTFLFTGKNDPSATQKQLAQYLLKASELNFLYLRMTLDLIENGDIVPKSAGFKIVPVNLNEVRFKLYDYWLIKVYNNVYCPFYSEDKM